MVRKTFLCIFFAGFLENKEKASGKKLQRNVFLSISGLHAKNYANLNKNKNKKTSPKFDIDWLCPRPFKYDVPLSLCE